MKKIEVSFWKKIDDEWYQKIMSFSSWDEATKFMDSKLDVYKFQIRIIKG